MAYDNNGSSVAIIAIIVIAILVAGAAFLYFQGDLPDGDSNPTVVERTTERNTIIEQDAPAPPPAPAVPENNTEGDFSFSQETDEDGDTETEIEATTDD